jgi:hypothetical protein
LKNKYNLDIEINDIPNICKWKFNKDHKKKTKFIVNAMLEHKIISADQFYPSFAHTESHVKQYENAINMVFENNIEVFK